MVSVLHLDPHSLHNLVVDVCVWEVVEDLCRHPNFCLEQLMLVVAESHRLEVDIPVCLKYEQPTE